MRLRPVHVIVLLVVFIFIRHRFVSAGRKYFLKKLLKGAVLASLVRPNYVPIPIPVPMAGHHGPLTGHLNTPHLPIPMSNLHHHNSWPLHTRHYSHHLPEFPLNNYHHPMWSGWSNDLAASMRSPIVTQSPHTSSHHLTTSLSSIPYDSTFGMPMSLDSSSSLITGKMNSDYHGNALSTPVSLTSMDNLIYPVSNDPLDPLSTRASSSTYSLRKLFKKDFKKNLI